MSHSQSREASDHTALHGIASSESELDEPAVASTATSDDGAGNATTFDSRFFDSFAMGSLQSTASAILAAQLAEQADGVGRDGRSYSIVSASESDASEARGRVKRSAGQVAPDDKHHVERHKWSAEETQALVDGCNKYGIGNWKAILSDENLSTHFEGRTPGDLKDRFRTYFPDAYHEMYPNAKTHNSRAIRSRAPDGTSIFEKGKTKERRPFTTAEDEVLKRGYERFGSHWAIIAKEPVFEGKRKSTDLRDRFRNAFPSLYEQAGYKPRSKGHKREQRHSGSGSFSHPEQARVPCTSDARSSFSSTTHLERPTLGWRSDTSISASSQAVSEHSEEESQGENLNWPQGDMLESALVRDPNASLMSRSKSFEASTSGSHGLHGKQEEVTSGTSAVPSAVSPTGHAANIAAKHGLRRTQSSKRSTNKISNLEHAARSASIKTSKEALLASHQHSHQQHVQQQQRAREQQHTGADAQERVWPPREGSDSQLPVAFTQMDLDPIDGPLDTHLAVTQPLGDNAPSDRHDGFRTVVPSLDKTSALDAFATDENPNSVAASNEYLANLYRELGYANQREPLSQRTFAIDSFQDLLDPLAPQQYSNNRWASTLSQMPFNLPTMQAQSSSTGLEQAGVQRRIHEHHHWAGDLLHRGSALPYSDWAPEQMETSVGEDGVDRRMNAQQSLGEQPRAPSMTTTQPQNRSVSDYTSGTAYNDILLRPARRLSNPPRPVGLDTGSRSLLSGNEQQQTAFSMDDLFLLGSNVPLYASSAAQLLSGATGSAVFEGNVNGEGEDEVRRRRSTDTLRGNANEPIRAYPIDAEDALAQMAVVEERPAPSSTVQSDGEHMRALLASFSAANNEEVDLPSRAASLGNLDLAVGRDQSFYAESLPDLTSSAFVGERSSSASETLFPSNQQQIQISFDDLDLPSYFNRSPAMAHLGAAGPAGGTSFSSPKLSNVGGVDINWLRNSSLRAGTTTLGDTGGLRQSFSAGPRDVGGTNNPFQQPSQSSAFSIALNDAGTLDRLEHLYLEGLHTPASPAVQFAQVQSSSAGITPHLLNSQRFGGGSTQPGFPPPSSSTFALDHRTGQAGEPSSGYESV